MPVTRVGDWCSRCLVRPALHGGVCRPCEELRRAFPGALEPLSGLEVELTLSVWDRRFDREVYGWINQQRGGS